MQPSGPECRNPGKDVAILGEAETKIRHKVLGGPSLLDGAIGLEESSEKRVALFERLMSLAL